MFYLGLPPRPVYGPGRGTLWKLATYRNVTFFVCRGPQDPASRYMYLYSLKRNDVFVVALARAPFCAATLRKNGIVVLDFFQEMMEGGLPQKTLGDWGSLIASFARDTTRSVCVTIEGFENFAFIVAEGLLVLGMNRDDVISVINRFDNKFGVPKSEILKILKKPEGNDESEKETFERDKKDAPLKPGMLLLSAEELLKKNK